MQSINDAIMWSRITLATPVVYDSASQCIKVQRNDTAILPPLECRLEADISIGPVSRSDTRLAIRGIKFDRVSQIRSEYEHIFDQPRVSIRDIDHRVRIMVAVFFDFTSRPAQPAEQQVRRGAKRHRRTDGEEMVEAP